MRRQWKIVEEAVHTGVFGANYFNQKAYGDFTSGSDRLNKAMDPPRSLVLNDQVRQLLHWEFH